MNANTSALGVLLTVGLLLPCTVSSGETGTQANGSEMCALSGTRTNAGCTQLAALFRAEARRYSVPVGLLRAVCYVESRHNIRAYRAKDGKTPSHGVCQVKERTATSLGFLGSARELQYPENSVRYAAAYLRYQLERYDWDLVRAIKAYNAGHARTRVHNVYVKSVLKAMKEGR